ncbi:GNAT family N-acetyltransferase [Saccharopolyspora sp. NFXS83]|uniref:GNAT family N-acetyltransferase n=1 Tax=Saccharopolyspora sp. NFXS83 TaxID=2993560 RepID=UPI00224AF6F2|nr:GNAT family N-acetyltransferase [Saccharopolyspora sp. NFXS83]MCX2732179.1 GNAT family N-acetyltransferase [Saccharopolyspora sp. NFXS83]
MSQQAIRRVAEADVPSVVRLVHALAEYEKAPDECHLTEPDLHRALFGESPALFGHVAEDDGEIAGFALWFLNFSTWEGRHGIYLEDLFVLPERRGSGLGKALLRTLAQECVARGYARLEWSVLDWNTPAIRFYESVGAGGMDEWTVHRLTGDALRTFGSA